MNTSKDDKKVQAPGKGKDAGKDKNSSNEKKVSSVDAKKVHASAPAHNKK